MARRNHLLQLDDAPVSGLSGIAPRRTDRRRDAAVGDGLERLPHFERDLDLRAGRRLQTRRGPSQFLLKNGKAGLAAEFHPVDISLQGRRTEGFEGELPERFIAPTDHVGRARRLDADAGIKTGLQQSKRIGDADAHVE
ncbi:hypothetical protein [Bradyrhizobium sp.]|uniref:hypothetical protein n=1 Tax=Bradyrhizobium sp. TaxID=376 RepID=UPI00292F7A6A|nr:hypothetical protein [Bradyrhizobium sp.]